MLQYLIRLNRQFANFLYENRNIGLITGKEVIIANILNLGNLDQIKMNASKPKDSSFLEFLTCNTLIISYNSFIIDLTVSISLSPLPDRFTMIFLS